MLLCASISFAPAFVLWYGRCSIYFMFRLGVSRSHGQMKLRIGIDERRPGWGSLSLVWGPMYIVRRKPCSISDGTLHRSSRRFYYIPKVDWIRSNQE